MKDSCPFGHTSVYDLHSRFNVPPIQCLSMLSKMSATYPLSCTFKCEGVLAFILDYKTVLQLLYIS